jgi:HNH endonuclease
VRRKERSGELRRELEDRIRNGSCVYCRAPAAPDRPLTREHVIPRARGGRRRDHRIIVPACARCNHRRGSQEVVLFLLARPRRITAFLDYLATLPPDTVRDIDIRVYGELYAALWLLWDSAASGPAWRERLRHLCAGRRLHRRRYAARRIVSNVGVKMERGASRPGEWPSCPLPVAATPRIGGQHRLEETLSRALSALVGTLSLAWDAPAARVLDELERERRQALEARKVRAGEAEGDLEDDEELELSPPEGDQAVLSLDGWKQRRGRRRTRVDRRGGRGRSPRGRAA